jgi:hypothetical protein
MKDTRELGKSYRYVVVPAGGLTVDGLKFRAGTLAVSKTKHRLLVAAGCEEIGQARYEHMLEEGSQDLPRETTSVAANKPRNFRKPRKKSQSLAPATA